MEDLELVALVRELFPSATSSSSSTSINVLPEKVLTSSRRWKEKGVFSTTLINQVINLRNEYQIIVMTKKLNTIFNDNFMQIVLFGRLIGVPYEVLVKW